MCVRCSNRCLLLSYFALNLVFLFSTINAWCLKILRVYIYAITSMSIHGWSFIAISFYIFNLFFFFFFWNSVGNYFYFVKLLLLYCRYSFPKNFTYFIGLKQLSLIFIQLSQTALKRLIFKTGENASKLILVQQSTKILFVAFFFLFSFFVSLLLRHFISVQFSFVTHVFVWLCSKQSAIKCVSQCAIKRIRSN